MYPPRSFYNKENRTWSGYKVQSIFHPDASVGQVILEVCRTNSDKVVQICHDSDIKLTAQEISQMSISAAKKFQEMGLEQEDIIGIIASNVPYLTPIVIAALVNGTPINALDPSFHKSDIKHMFEITKPKLLFVNASLVDEVEEVLSELEIDTPIYTIDKKIENVQFVDEFLRISVDAFIPPTLKNGGCQTAVIICSSGTTGLPKGVCLPHNGLIQQLMRLITFKDVVITFSTIYWLSGLLFLLDTLITGATRIITSQPYRPELFLEIVEKHGVTISFMPPPKIALLLNCFDFDHHDTTSLRCILSGAGSVPITIENAIRERLKRNNGIFLVGYGMTESIGRVTIQNPYSPVTGSDGQLVPNFELKIINDKGKSLKPNQQGEICIRTPFQSRYYNDPEANSLTFDENGWIHSGDIGYIDTDGNLYVVDRKKDIFMYKNFHVYPSEIEDVILEISDVVEVCVCGIPDLICSDLPAAAVVLREESTITEDDIYNHVASKLSHYKHLRGGVYFLKELIRTPSGTVRRRFIRDILTDLKNSSDTTRM